jgi:inner membrane protein
LDPISQAALGAAVAHGCFGRQLGPKAMVWGAAAGALPDIDVLFALAGDDFDQLVMHRGITHSLLFAPLIGPLMGWLLWRRGRRRGREPPDSLIAWIGAMTVALWSHPLLDVLTPYGTQLLMPFSNARFAVNAMPIIDPLYTLILIAGLAVAATWAPHNRGRLASACALVLSTAYLGYGWYLNEAARSFATNQLATEGVTDAEVHAFPTIFQIHYRRIVARLPNEDKAGFLSMWDPCHINWQTAPNHTGALIEAVLATREGAIFDWFTLGFTHASVEPSSAGTTLLLSHLRYGFDDDPRNSVFAAIGLIDATNALAAPLVMRQVRPSAGDPRMRNLFNLVYGYCRG